MKKSTWHSGGGADRALGDGLLRSEETDTWLSRWSLIICVFSRDTFYKDRRTGVTHLKDSFTQNLLVNKPSIVLWK